MKSSARQLICPKCSTSYPADRRYCLKCEEPLIEANKVHSLNELATHAYKIKPEYAQGDLVKVRMAQNQAEAEFIQAMLLEEGIPSIIRRSAGFDVPDFLAAGPRDVLIPRSGLQAAKELFVEAGLVSKEMNISSSNPSGYKIFFWLFLALVIAAIIIWLIS